MSNFYDLTVKTPSGQELNMADYKGKPVLIINTATKCGLAPQFDGLEKLHQDYKEKGLVVLGFPCNQFAGQEPETNDSVIESCKINHGVTFQLTEKIEVNGANAHPIFKHLKKEKGGFILSSIKWNFTKFLVNKEGKVIQRYSPTTAPDKIAGDIEAIIK
jgi:glutathione peroxidase